MDLDKVNALAIARYIENNFRIVNAITRMKLGIPTPLHKVDRYILEQVILPYFADNNKYNRILFVGCEYYTWHYKKIYRYKEYWTIEPELMKKMFGSERHIVGLMSDINKYFKKNSLDLIICNGVLGFGLNDPRDIEDSFNKCHECLRKDGVLVIGWNNVKERVFLPLEKCESLKKFEPFTCPPLGTSSYSTKSQNYHTFNFYLKT